jgi:hypothetical protein
MVVRLGLGHRFAYFKFNEIAFIVVILEKILDSGVVSSEFRILFWGEGV